MRVIGFGSFKGGVGKTTMALCACEMRRPPSDPHKPKRHHKKLAPAPVILIDADIAGTEVHDLLDGPYRTSAFSLLDILSAPPSTTLKLDKLVEEAAALKPGQILVVSTFGTISKKVEEIKAWKQVLERSGPYARHRLRDLLSKLAACDNKLAIVVDLPAFDVGFATEAHRAIEDLDKDVVPRGIRYVTDFDRRSFNELVRNRAAAGPKLYEGVCLNEIPVIDESVLLDLLKQRLDESAPAAGPPPYSSGIPTAPSSTTQIYPIRAYSFDELRNATSLLSGGKKLPSKVEVLIDTLMSEPARLWTDGAES